MAAPRTLANFWAQPATKREAHAMALKLLCLGSFIMIGLIMAGVL
jgi:hypothetical protein